MSLFRVRLSLRLAAVFAALAPVLRAWDYEGHRIVNQLALAALPKEYPNFVHAVANAERVAFLAGEPDRWRNAPDLPLRHYNAIDHYCDMEYIPAAGLDWATVPSFRYDFVVQFAAGRAKNAQNFLPFDPAKNADRTREWPGFAPWAITEYYGKLRSAFSYLKVFEELGTADEVMNAQANIIYLMGVMGHHIGDCAQPLHTTKHHNGWVGRNPNGYTTWPGFHAWIDGGFIAKAGVKTAGLLSRVAPAAPISLAPRDDGRDPMFVAVVEYLKAQHEQVDVLYRMEKAGQMAVGEQPVTPEGRAFIEGQLLRGAQMLAAIWVTAERAVVPDNYLRTALIRRQTGVAPATMPPRMSTPKQ